jgi:hypothetical protein
MGNLGYKYRLTFLHLDIFTSYVYISSIIKYFIGLKKRWVRDGKIIANASSIKYNSCYA